MVNLRTFTISDETFGGFSTHVDLDTVDSIDQICNVVMECLNEALSSINLSVLSRKCTEIECPYTRCYHWRDVIIEP